MIDALKRERKAQIHWCFAIQVTVQYTVPAGLEQIALRLNLSEPT
jgi:hypothetical protein